MRSITQELHFNSPINEVFNAYKDIEIWPLVLENTISVESKFDNIDFQNFTMTVSKDGELERVQTIRYLERNKKISMFQLKTPPGVKSMFGVWEFFELKTGTKVKATRYFELENPSKQVNDKFEKNLSFMLNVNLESFKRYCERYIFSVCETIDVDYDLIINDFWNIRKWYSIWNPIDKVDVLEGNDNFQRFQMEFQKNDVFEKVITRRFKEENKISFISEMPPKLMNLHFGSWEFAKTGNLVTVVATREFQFENNEDKEFNDSFSKDFKNRVHNILLAFKEYYERNKY